MRHFAFEIYSDQALEDVILKMEKDRQEHDSFLVSHLYCGGYEGSKCRKIIKTIDDRLKERSVVIGVASNAEFLEGRVTDPIPVLSVMCFDESEAELLYESDIDKKAADIGSAFAKRIDEAENVQAVEVLICNSGEQILDLLRKLESCDNDIPIFGGMPFGHDILNDPRFIVTSTDVTEKGVAAILYKGKNLHVDTDYTCGWKPLGKNLRVTKAQNCTIYEINNEPAINIYKKYLGIGENDGFMQNTSEFPLMVKKAGGDMLRHPETTNENGSIDLDGYVETGMIARISYGDPETIIEDINERCRALTKFAPEAVLIYSCAARMLFWGSFINNEVAPFGKLAPMAGYCTGGEISRDRDTGEIMWHNITVVSVGFREGEKKKSIAEAPEVNMANMHGQTLLVKRLMTLVKETTRELEEMAIKDGLTGLYNRRETERLIDETLEKNHVTSLIMADIDHFKNVNDVYGHNTGDVVLKKAARMLRTIADENGGFAGRWGGEEFFVTLPDTDDKKAYEIAEKLRENIAATDFEEVGHVTVSLGIITINEKVNWVKERNNIYATVDNALYEAKNSGRNRTVTASAVI